jgi:hypothetical protein
MILVLDEVVEFLLTADELLLETDLAELPNAELLEVALEDLPTLATEDLAVLAELDL